MSYWDRNITRLAWVMTDEMNSAGEGTPAQHEILAMAWTDGYRFAHIDTAEAERHATTDLQELQDTESKALEAIMKDYPQSRSRHVRGNK